MTNVHIQVLREPMQTQRSDIRDYLESEGVDVSSWEVSDKASNEPAGKHVWLIPADRKLT